VADKPKNEWIVPQYTDDDIRAIQAIALYAQSAEIPPAPGNEPAPPTALDCKRALDWIIYKAAGYLEEPFAPGQADVTDYLLGRASVGRNVVKLMKLRIVARSNHYLEQG
jgi:hypothetical protein